MKNFIKKSIYGILVCLAQTIFAQQLTLLRYPLSISQLYTKEQFDKFNEELNRQFATRDPIVVAHTTMKLADATVALLHALNVISQAQNLADIQDLARSHLHLNAVEFRKLLRNLGFYTEALSLINVPITRQTGFTPDLSVNITRLAEAMPRQYAYNPFVEGKYTLLPP